MASDSGRQRWARRLVTLALLCALFLPVLRDRDGLPLSTYPMYASARSNIVSFVTVRAFTASGEAEQLSMFTIARTRDPLIAESFLADSVRRGDADELCAEVALRADDPVTRIEVATERFDVAGRSSGDPPFDRIVHATCAVMQ
jgi:hypothetical protein